ncbi:MAG: ribosomal protein L13e [Candidatus Bathyarchaeota archaeon]|nr:MAG: ribosomal protein L13e [Candidatus Bathyarchaeota archaeon]
MRKELLVNKRHGRTRSGRGFSRKELKKVKVTPKQALRLGLPIDQRRRTLHTENAKLAATMLKSKTKPGKQKLHRTKKRR